MLVSSTKGQSGLFSRERRRRFRLPLSLLLLVVLIAVFGLVNPAGIPADINPANVSLPAPTSGPTPRPAPTDIHGGRIVFTCTRKEVNQICMIRADGTGYDQLTEGSSNSYYPAISPDGKHIVFATNQYDYFDLFRLAPDVREGQRSSESRLSRLTTYIGNAFSPSFSPDGRRLIFVNRVGEQNAALWMMGSRGEDPHPIYTPAGDVVGAAWSPDGQSAALAISTGHSFAYQVYLLDLEDPRASPKIVSAAINDLGGSIAWSPNQSDLLIFAGPAAAREIYRLDVATGTATQLTFGGNNASAAYSPDGQYIVFNSLRNNGQADLFVMRADGHSTRQLTYDPEPDWQPQWGP